MFVQSFQHLNPFEPFYESQMLLNKIHLEILTRYFLLSHIVFDSVISLFHIASYQNTDEDVKNYFKTASIHVKKGGKFIFDLWYKPAVLTQRPEKRVKELENDEIKVVRYCTPEHLEDKNIVKVHYKIDITNKKTGNQQVVEETHSMRYFSSEDVEKFAKEAGFKIVLEEEWLTKNKPSEDTWGVCFVAEKL